MFARRTFDDLEFCRDRVVARILGFRSCVVRFDGERGLDPDDSARQRALDQMRGRR
jgi:hypothetical protein